MKNQIWYCKIGVLEESVIRPGSDFPMRRAVEKAYFELTGKMPEFLFSGWGAELDQYERETVKRHEPIQT